MTWAFFAISASFIWAIVNIVDKFLLTKWVRKPVVLLIVMGAIGLVVAIIIFVIRGFSYLSTINIILAFIAGVAYIIANLFYFKAAQIEEISRVAPLFHLAPLFVLILAAIFLGEVFTPLKYLGIFLLIIGATLISAKSFKLSFGKAFWLMILSVFSFSIDIILTKYLLDFTDFWTVFAYIRIGAIFALIPVFIFYFNELKSTIRKHGKKVIGLISANESLNVIGVLFSTIAAFYGFVTLVEALASMQALFVLIIAVILSIFYPKILKEKYNKKIILQKLIAIIFMIIGAILIT